MIEGSLSRRYGRALFQLAVGEGREEEVGQEIARFAAWFQNPALNSVLNNPAFAVQNRKNIVVAVCRDLQISLLVIHFLSLLLDHDRLSFFAAIVERYRKLLDEKKGQVEARVIAAIPLEDDDLERLREALEKVSAKHVVTHQETAPTLIGGLIIHLEGKIYDGSIRSQLENIRQRVERES